MFSSKKKIVDCFKCKDFSSEIWDTYQKVDCPPKKIEIFYYYNSMESQKLRVNFGKIELLTGQKFKQQAKNFQYFPFEKIYPILVFYIITHTKFIRFWSFVLSFDLINKPKCHQIYIIRIY